VLSSKPGQSASAVRSLAWVTSPFSNQTWLAGKCPTKMEVLMGKSTKNGGFSFATLIAEGIDVHFRFVSSNLM
jgi:hypothetical protein